MAYEMKPNSGSVFKNKNRRPDRDDAAYTGTALIDGKEYWFNVWPKKDKNGDTWLSCSFNEKKPRTNAPASAPPSSPPQADDIDFPF